MICVVGNKGNMGRRYETILRSLKVTHCGYDIDTTVTERSRMKERAEGFIVATPTKDHATTVLELLGYQRPLLVEKPFDTDYAVVNRTLLASIPCGTPIQMVNQYRHMGLRDSDEGSTFYDYWNHGRDGLAWDTISVIALARGPVWVEEKSPVWKCHINSRQLSIAQMDVAYISMIQEWIDNKSQSDHEYIHAAHKAVLEYEKCCQLRSS